MNKDKQVGGDHYSRFDIQPFDIIREYKLNYWEGNVIKYLLRHTIKGGKQDLLKSLHYLEFLLENYEELFHE